MPGHSQSMPAWARPSNVPFLTLQQPPGGQLCCKACLQAGLDHGRMGAGETMISGITGEEFVADIFLGPVYYQRLRHMVADKFQVRPLSSKRGRDQLRPHGQTWRRCPSRASHPDPAVLKPARRAWLPSPVRQRDCTLRTTSPASVWLPARQLPHGAAVLKLC